MVMWGGHSCPLPLMLILKLGLGDSWVAWWQGHDWLWISKGKIKATAKAADRSVRPTRVLRHRRNRWLWFLGSVTGTPSL